jgi:hypothetical protein
MLATITIIALHIALNVRKNGAPEDRGHEVGVPCGDGKMPKMTKGVG